MQITKEEYNWLKYDEWLEKRRHYLMATDAAVIMGASRWGNKLSLYKDKAGIKKDSRKETPAMRYGKECEPLLINLWKLDNPQLSHYLTTDDRENKWCFFAECDGIPVGCTPDATYYRDNELGILEIKTSSLCTDWDDTTIPQAYYLQCLHMFLASSSLKEVTIFVRIKHHTDGMCAYEKEYLVPRPPDDDVNLNSLLAAEKEFWQCVVNKTPPK